MDLTIQSYFSSRCHHKFFEMDFILLFWKEKIHFIFIYSFEIYHDLRIIYMCENDFSHRQSVHENLLYIIYSKTNYSAIVCMKGPGPPDDDSPLESQPSELGRTFSQHNQNLNNNHSNTNLNHNHNNNHIHGSHNAAISDQRDQIGSRQGSLSSERDFDSCSGNNSAGNGGGSEVESPNETYTESADNDVFDWWFHRNRNSKKSR